LRDPHAPISRAHGLIMLTLAGDRISTITGFTDNSGTGCWRTALAALTTAM
jgi:hypothetical protein